MLAEIFSNTLIYSGLEIVRSLAWQLLYPGWNLPKKAQGGNGIGLRWDRALLEARQNLELARIKAGRDV